MKTGQRNVVSMLICRNSYFIFYKAIKNALNLVCQARFCFKAQFITWRGKMNMIDLQIQRDGSISFQKMYDNLWESLNFYMFTHIFCFKSSKLGQNQPFGKKAEIYKEHFNQYLGGYKSVMGTIGKVRSWRIFLGFKKLKNMHYELISLWKNVKNAVCQNENLFYKVR